MSSNNNSKSNLTEDLPVFQQSYKLFKHIIEIIPGFNKVFQKSIGDQLIENMTKCINLIESANIDSKNRIEHLTNFQAVFGTVKTLLKLCSETKLVGNNKYAQILILEDSIGKQTTAWKKSVQPQGLTTSSSPFKNNNIP